MGESKTATDDAMIVLYRAVKPDALADIQQTGQLINRGIAEGNTSRSRQKVLLLMRDRPSRLLAIPHIR